MNLHPTLNIPQAKFLAMKHKFRAYVAGFGAGKTWAGCAAQCQTSYEFPKVTLGYFAPTYPQIRDIYFPTMEEVCHNWGLRSKTNEGNKEVHIYSAGFYRSTVICRSMEKPNTIIGFKIGRAMVDEIDTMNEVKATNAWNKILARLRLVAPGLLNGADLTTTPEGFKFTYKKFSKDPKPSYGMVQARTYDNEIYLPEDYIDSLLESYPAELIKAYLSGQFVNLTSGSVYTGFNRIKNASFQEHDGFEPLYIGMDFNVMHMAAVIHVMRDGKPHAVMEFVDIYDTPTMCTVIKEYYGMVEDFFVYPDASGRNSSSKDYSETDFAILEREGFEIISDTKNPAIKDRVNSMNAMFCNGKGERNYYVNVARCPKYVDALEQQVYDKNGMPDKSTGIDHVTDAPGYFIVREFPIERHQFGNQMNG